MGAIGGAGRTVALEDLHRDALHEDVGRGVRPVADQRAQKSKPIGSRIRFGRLGNEEDGRSREVGRQVTFPIVQSLHRGVPAGKALPDGGQRRQAGAEQDDS